MKRAVLGLFALLALSGARAQNDSFYLGLRVDGVGDLATLQPVATFLGFQAGAIVVANLELRLSLSTLLLAGFAQADVLYTRDLSDALRLYAGGGSGVAGAAVGDAVSYYFVHATAGAEYRPGGGPGLFAEVQPLYGLNRDPFTGDASAGALGGKLSLGVNFYP